MIEAPYISLKPEKRTSGRLASIDALRGFDMLMIAGGGQFIYLLKGKTGYAWVDTIAEQLEHPEWHGFTFYDFIFPLFLFLAGTSLAFSLSGGLANGIQPKVLIRKVFWRMLILIGLGILDKNAPIDLFDPAHIRYGSVLGRIGLATFISTLLFLRFDFKRRLYIGCGILILYFLAVAIIPVPGFGGGDFSFEGNLVGWFDRTFMPGRLKQGTYDELAILTQFPAICLTLFGTLAGQILLKESPANKKVSNLLSFGIVGIILAIIWSPLFPINKHLWSSPFILLTAGMAFILLSIFYWIIDIKGYVRWSFFFRVIGMNSLAIYLAFRFVDFGESSRLLFEGIYKYSAPTFHEVFNALGATVLVWLFLYFLYKNKIFIKV